MSLIEKLSKKTKRTLKNQRKKFADPKIEYKKTPGKKRTRQASTEVNKKLPWQAALLDAIAKKFGGYKELGDLLQKKLGEEFSSGSVEHRFINWRERGGVTVTWLFKIADALKVPPAALNYSAVIDELKLPKPYSMTRKQAIQGCEFDRETEKHLLSLEA